MSARMKILLTAGFVVSGFVASGVAWAKPNFNDMKSRALKNIDENMSVMQKTKDCVSAAKAMPDLKQCRMEARQTRMEKRSEHMQKRMEKMKEHQEKKSGS